MIAANSRYANSVVQPATNLDGADIMAIIFSVPVDTTFSFAYHQVRGDDTVDLLAWQNYSDPSMWWIIANANPEIIDWTTLPVGKLLRIPSLGSLIG